MYSLHSALPLGLKTLSIKEAVFAPKLYPLPLAGGVCLIVNGRFLWRPGQLQQVLNHLPSRYTPPLLLSEQPRQQRFPPTADNPRRHSSSSRHTLNWSATEQQSERQICKTSPLLGYIVRVTLRTCDVMLASMAQQSDRHPGREGPTVDCSCTRMCVHSVCIS